MCHLSHITNMTTKFRLHKRWKRKKREPIRELQFDMLTEPHRKRYRWRSSTHDGRRLGVCKDSGVTKMLWYCDYTGTTNTHTHTENKRRSIAKHLWKNSLTLQWTHTYTKPPTHSFVSFHTTDPPSSLIVSFFRCTHTYLFHYTSQEPPALSPCRSNH